MDNKKSNQKFKQIKKDKTPTKSKTAATAGTTTNGKTKQFINNNNNDKKSTNNKSKDNNILSTTPTTKSASTTPSPTPTNCNVNLYDNNFTKKSSTSINNDSSLSGSSVSGNNSGSVDIEPETVYKNNCYNNHNTYNDYVNNIYDNDDDDHHHRHHHNVNNKHENELLLLKNNSSTESTSVSGCGGSDFIGDGGCCSSGSVGCNDDEKNEDIKPLIEFQQHTNNNNIIIDKKRPKSIVKSPSAQSFIIDTNSINYRPRLSLQPQTIANTSGQQTNGGDGIDRPVLHVQFQHSKLDNSDNEHDNNELRSPVGSISSEQSDTNASSSSSSSSEDENSSIGQYSEARPPDGGWGWVVVFAAFMVNMIADGITFSFGVIYVEFLNYFGEGKAKTAWIGSLFMAMPLLSGPISSFLTDRYGCRKVTIVGSILACSGFVASSFANSMEMLFFTFGIVSGFGLSLCYVAAVVIVAYYFDKRRSFATGLSVCGSGIGTFIFAPLTQMLITEYGWRGTTLILAGAFLNMTVCGMLMRDLEWTTHRAKLKAKQKKRGSSKIGISADSFSVSNSTNTGSNLNPNDDDVFDTRKNSKNIIDPSVSASDDTRLFSSLINLPTFIKNGEKVPLEVLELLATHRNVRTVLLQNYPNLLHSRSFSEPFASSRTGLANDNSTIAEKNTEILINGDINNDEKIEIPECKTEQEFLTWLRRNSSHHHHVTRPNSAYFKDLRMHRHSLTYRGAMLNINRYRLRASSCPDIYRNSMTTIAKEKTQWYQGIGEFKNLLVDILDFSYFTDIRFLLFSISNFLLYTWYDVPYVYLADNAIEIGFNESDASTLISLIGIVNMFGEIILGWVGDKSWISANLVYAISMAFCGAVTALVPLFKTYEALSVISGCFGLFIAANYSLTSIILVELITLEKFTSAYGLLLLVQGIANLVGPPLAGYIYDLTGTYDLSFYLGGIFIATSGILLLILPAIGKYKKYKALKRQNSGNKDKSSNDIKYSETGQTGKTNGTTALLTDCFRRDLKDDVNKINHV